MFERISLTHVPAPFIAPRRKSLTRDFEWGGVALQNVSKGLLYKVWEAYYSGRDIYISNGTTAHLVVRDIDAPTYISLAFDVNMNYALAYIVGGTLYWKWFDSVSGTYTTTAYANITSVHCSLDDPRAGADTWNDVVLFYTSNDNLYYRLQRERYTIAHLICPLVGRVIWQTGMTKNLRLQVRHVLNKF